MMARARRVIICVNRFDVPDIWAVRWGTRWFTGKTVEISIPLTTVFKGPTARQPKAYLAGTGVVRARAGHLTVTGA